MPTVAELPKITPRPLPGRFGELVPSPFQRIHIELTNVCNFDCTFCPKQNMTRQYQYMPYEKAIAIIDEIAEYGMAEKITFHVMGEPFMHPQFFEILDYAADRGVTTGITTNGTYLSSDIAERLKPLRVGQINISLQTPDEESYKTRKSRDMDFEEYKENILEFIGWILNQPNPPKLKVHFLNTLLKSEVPGEDWNLGTMSVINNTRELRNTFSYWAREIHSLLPNMPDVAKEDVQSRINKLTTFKWNVVNIAEGIFFETYILNSWGNAFVGDHYIPSRIGYCSALTDHFAILCNGDLTYCCVDYDGKTAAGNAFENSIVDILNKPDVIAAVEGFKKFQVVHPHCQKCLGGRTWLSSLANQVGSIVIWKFLKDFFYNKKA